MKSVNTRLITLATLAINVFVFAACATMQSISVDQRSRIFDADYMTTLKGALDYLNTNGWQISNVDKDLGIVNTEFKTTSGLSALFTGDERWKINFTVQKVSATQTRVIANMLYEQKSGLTGWTQANMTEGEAVDRYNKILDGVGKAIVK